MSRVTVLEASCIAGVVKVGILPVLATTIIGQGIGPSTGVLLIMGDDTRVYVAKTSPDLDTALQSLITALTDVAATLTAIGAGMTGPTTAPPPTLAVSVASITTQIAALTTLKGILK